MVKPKSCLLMKEKIISDMLLVVHNYSHELLGALSSAEYTSLL